ncbi:MAG: hypothetical protein WD038_01760 [Balneolales bacterium]
MADIYFQICTSDRFNNTTGSLISSDLNIITPAQTNLPLNFYTLISELWNTKHMPAYATNPEHINKMWALSKKVGYRNK